ncbi:MAG: hypothetical protein ABI207_01105, partial [Crocinitomicaceae bacterium]
GTNETIKIPAEIWRFQPDIVTKVFTTEKQVKNIVIDPLLETADTDVNNNFWKGEMKPSRFKLFMGKQN